MKLTRESRTFVLLLDSANPRFPDVRHGIDALALQHLGRLAASGRLVDRLRALAIAAYPTEAFPPGARHKKAIAPTLADGQGLEFLFGVSAEALRLWRTSTPPLRDAAIRHVDGLIERMVEWRNLGELKTSVPLRDALADCIQRLQALRAAIVERARTYEVRVILGFDRDTDAQLAIDRILYRDRPLLLSAYYDTQSPVESGLLEAHKSEVVGVFYVWARREQLHARGTYSWWRQPLRVRYSIEAGGQAFIRAKMTVPNVRDPGAPWDYDGVVIVRDLSISFLLESRSPVRQDVFSLIVGHPHPVDGSSQSTSGRYLTTAQDSDQTVITGRVVLEQIARLHRHISSAAPEAHDVMHSHASIFDDPGQAEYVRAESMWDTIATRAKGADGD